MVEGYHIIKGGITNYVDVTMFERVYKPAGWVIDPAFHEVPRETDVKVVEAKSEAEIKNYHAMKKTKSTKRVFNDKIIKGK